MELDVCEQCQKNIKVHVEILLPFNEWCISDGGYFCSKKCFIDYVKKYGKVEKFKLQSDGTYLLMGEGQK